MQPDSTPSFPQATPPNSIPQYAPPPSTPKRNINFLAIIGGVFICILTAAVLGLGVWAYQLNTNLTASEQNFATLQKEYNQLKGDYDKQTVELGQTKSELEKTQTELEKTKTDLATAQTDLEKANKDKETVLAKMAEAKKYADVAVAMFVNRSSSVVLKTKIKLTEDATLLDLYEKADAPGATDMDIYDFFSYLFDTLVSKLE